MRRYAYILLFFLVLVLPFGMRWWLVEGSDSAPMAAAGDRIVVITPHNQDIRREFALAFSRWHRARFGSAVDLDFRSIGGTNDIKRLLQTTYAGFRDAGGKLKPADQVNVGYDMVWGGGDNFFDADLKPLGILDPLDPDVVRAALPEATLAGTRLYDAAHDDPAAPIRWAGVCLSSFGIVFNPDLLWSLQLPVPGRWQDLAAPELAGKVALADPTHSGSAAIAYMMVIQRAMADAEDAFYAEPAHALLRKTPKERWPADAAASYNDALGAGWKAGMRTMVRVAANARYFTDSAEQVPTDVGNGDAACGMAIDFYGRVEEATVGPGRARFVAPRAATAVTPDPVAILYGATGRRRELADHFVEFLLSKEGQLLWIKKPGTPLGPARRGLGRSPIRRDVYADQSDWSDRIDPFHDAGTFNLRGAWMATFGEVRPIWSAAWIDDRDALKDAYDKILGIKDEAERDRRLWELSDLPVDMKEVLTSAAARSLATATDPAKRRATIAGLAGLGLDSNRVQGLESELRAAILSGDMGIRDARARMEWAMRFRRHYEDVARRAASWEAR